MSSMRDSSRKTSKKLTRMGMLLGVWAMKSKFKKTNLLLQGLHCKLVKKKVNGNEDQSSSDDADSEDDESDDEWVTLDSGVEFAMDYQGPLSKRRFF